MNTPTMTPAAEFSHILATHAIQPHFQPIITADGHSIYAYEALSRGPADSVFHNPLPLFEYAKSQNRLFALERICRTKAIDQFTGQQLQGKLFINVSPETLLQPDHQRGLTRDLASRFGISPARVVIEITEHDPTHDYTLMRQAVNHYRSEGFSIALDDLGAGYSSLRLWSELQPEFVKIDRHFICDIDQDNFKRHFVSSILGLARLSNSQVIAEGVETQQEFQVLHEIGVDFFQGYFFGKPNPTGLSSVLQPRLTEAKAPPHVFTPAPMEASSLY